MSLSRTSHIRIRDVAVYFIPLELRVPLRFGRETVTQVTCSRVAVTAENAAGRREVGWGETPLNVPWAWPAELSHRIRLEALKAFTMDIARVWKSLDLDGHPIELGYRFVEEELEQRRKSFNASHAPAEALPRLAALVAVSPFDIACHDVYGRLHDVPVYRTYNGRFMSRDLAAYLESAAGSDVSFRGRYPEDFLKAEPPRELVAWHMVGGRDLLDDSERAGGEPDDGYPVTLREWIRRDGLECLKVKLRGTDWEWDYERLARVGRLASEEGVLWLSADFNCTVETPEYVTDILHRLLREQPRLFGMLLYVEQPFPDNLERNRIDARAVSALKPLLMDESAYDWRSVRLGRQLGWSGVALKTCKTQTGALLMLAWARAHGMTLMVQDLTNPMLAQIPHVLLAAHADPLVGVETNAMQFYPEASQPEAAVHPGLFRRKNGKVRLDTIRGSGFGYRTDEIGRQLPPRSA